LATVNEEIYLLKGTSLYSVVGDSALRTVTPIAIDEVTNSRYQLIIDDSSFFYVYIGKLSVSRKKVRAVIGNYLQSLFPADLFADFTYYEDKGVYIALLYRKEFQEFATSEIELFRKARRISTVFCELVSRYETFLFTDGARVYEKKEDGLESLASTPEGTLTSVDLIAEMIPLKADIALPGIKRSREAMNKYQALIATVACCYILFLAAGIIGNMAESKRLAGYERQLQELYEKAGVASSPDPYGILISRSDRKLMAPYRVMDVLNSLGAAVTPDIKIDLMSLNEKTMRIEGFAPDFAAMEALKSSMESTLKKPVTIDDSRQSGEQIKFTIRYEP
jgi:hypothetical protein